MGWIEKVQEMLTMEEVLQRYIGSPDRAKKYLCPFHSDKHPSLSINPKTGRFTCFSCGERGDMIDFAQKLYNVDQKNALLTLSRDFNLGLENSSDEPEKIRADRMRRELEKKRAEELKIRVDNQKRQLFLALRVVRDCYSSNAPRPDEKFEVFMEDDRRTTACMWAVYQESWILWLLDCIEERPYDAFCENCDFAFDLWAIGRLPTDFADECDKNAVKQRKMIVLEKLEKGEFEPICKRNTMT